MASATEKKITFTCPHCDKVLRSSSRPPADKEVKCPACGQPFVPDIAVDEDATQFQEKRSAKSKGGGKDDPDESPRRKKSRDDDDEDDRPRGKKKKSRDADDEDDDDGPPRKRKKYDDDDLDDSPIKKKSKKKSGSPLLLIALFLLLGGGALFSCALCGVGAFIWPGFLRSNNAALAAFIPPDANIVMGANPKLLKTKFANLERMLRRQNPNAPKQAEWEDITFNCERMLAFGNAMNFENAVVAVYQSNSSDIAKVKRNPHLGGAQTIGGHANVHKATAEGERQGLMPWVAFPGGNIVLTSKTEKELVAALDHAKKKGKLNETYELGKSLDRSTMWFAFTPDARTLADLRRQMEFGGGAMMPGLRDAAPAIGDIKGLTVAMDLDGKDDFNLNAALICKNAGDAAKIKTGIDGVWNLAMLALNAAAGGGGMQMPGQPPIPKSFIADLNTTKFAVEGANVTATMKIQSQTITELARLGAQGPGPFNPPPNNPPPFIPPPNNPPFNPPPVNGKPVGPNPPTQLQLNGGLAMHNGVLLPTDNTFNGRLHKQYNVTFQQGKMYQIDHKRANKGAGFMDPYLILIDPDGRVVAENDDFAGLDSRIDYRAQRTGTYQILATSLGGRDTGPFTLTVRQIGN